MENEHGTASGLQHLLMPRFAAALACAVGRTAQLWFVEVWMLNLLQSRHPCVWLVLLRTLCVHSSTSCI